MEYVRRLEPKVRAMAQDWDRLSEKSTRLDNGWVPFGWHIAYPDVRLEFDGHDCCGDPVWERNAVWGLSIAEQEAAAYELPDDADRCADLTKSPRGWLQCQLPAGHEVDPRSLHHVDPAGPVLSEADREARGES